VVLSHYDGDHLNGAPELFARLDILAVALPDVSPEDPIAWRLRRWRNRRARGSSISPSGPSRPGRRGADPLPPQGGAGDNENGLTVLGTAGDFDVLITGDMGSATERGFLNTTTCRYRASRRGASRLQILHFGRLFGRRHPEAAVISVGYNSYGHPAEETLERLEEHHIAVYRPTATEP
jgi:competence protein ComEC